MRTTGRSGSGYGRPPIAHQFQPGKSGNPKGRPKGSRNIATLLDEELDRTVSVLVGGQRERLPKRRVMVRKLADKAMTGDARATAQVIALQSQHENTGGSPQPESSLVDDLAEDQGLAEKYAAYLASLMGMAQGGGDVPADRDAGCAPGAEGQE